MGWKKYNNKFIEVKSTWTYQKDIHKIDAIKARVKNVDIYLNVGYLTIKKK